MKSCEKIVYSFFENEAIAIFEVETSVEFYNGNRRNEWKTMKIIITPEKIL